MGIAILAGCSGQDEAGIRPDPAVRSVTLDPLQPEAGAQFKLKVRIENLTDFYASRVSWRVRKDGQTQLTGTITGLEGHEVLTLDVPINSTAGSFTYAFQVNWDGSLSEAYEGNNAALITVVVQPSGNG